MAFNLKNSETVSHNRKSAENIKFAC